MISADRALELILERVPLLGTVTLSAGRAAGYRLAGDVAALSDVPPFDNAGMDGYAVRSVDVPGAPVVLAIAGETFAGDPPGAEVTPGEARAVMTGAPVPPGADAVVPFEWTARVSSAEVRVLRPVEAGANIRKRGSDVEEGSVPLGAGRLLRPFELGVVASLGVEFVNVRRKPTVLVVPTGNELVPPGRQPGPGMVRESVTPVLAGLLRDEGCDVVVAPIVPDDAAKLTEAVHPRDGRDVVITVGGVSAGTRDVLPAAFAAAGYEAVFHKVNIKPGMPLLFAMRGAVPAFGLPGNPVSAVVTFIRFVRPAIRKMSGDPEPRRRTSLKARLAVAISKKDGKRHYQRGCLETVDGFPVVRPAGPQVSNRSAALAASNCLIVLPEETGEFPESSMVEVELL